MRISASARSHWIEVRHPPMIEPIPKKLKEVEHEHDGDE
jgi:hypothetical protein